MNGTSAGKKGQEGQRARWNTLFHSLRLFVLAQRLPTTLLHREHEKNGPAFSRAQGTELKISGKDVLYSSDLVTLSAESFVTDNGRSDNFT